MDCFGTESEPEPEIELVFVVWRRDKTGAARMSPFESRGDSANRAFLSS